MGIRFSLYVFTYEMGSRGRPIFDLNEPPAEDNEENDSIVSLQPQKALPSTTPHTSEMLAVAAGTQGIVNNHAFSHASSVSGFQPFIRPKYAHGSEGSAEQKEARERNPNNATLCTSSNNEDIKAVPTLVSAPADASVVEREEGEWSDADISADAHGSGSLREQGKTSQEHEKSGAVDGCNIKVSDSLKDESSNSSRNSDSNAKGHSSMDCQEEPGLVLKQEKVKGIESSRALKGANNPVKRKMDQHNEAKLGKKRSRQTMFLNLEDVKQAGPIKSSTPRRQPFPAPVTTRTMKEVRTISPPAVPPPTERIGEKQSQPIIKDQKQPDVLCSEGGIAGDSSESKTECNGDVNYGSARLKRQIGDTDSSAEVLPPIPRQSSWKQPTDMRLPKNSQVAIRKPVTQTSMDSKSGNKKHIPAKKQTTVSNMYQDTSVERLIREVTNEKFWHNPGTIFFFCIYFFNYC